MGRQTFLEKQIDLPHKNNMPAFLEHKLEKEYGKDNPAVYATMNKIGAMHGNKKTEKGREMEEKHKIHHQAKAIKKNIK